LPVTAGAEYSISLLKELDDANRLRVWVLTKTPSGSPYAFSEIVLCYRKNFKWLVVRVILTHDKYVVGDDGDYLLDDRPHKANAEKFKGKFCLFLEDDPVGSWERFVKIIETRVQIRT
jgi:5'(3')-deoxyribonucleotidase